MKLAHSKFFFHYQYNINIVAAYSGCVCKPEYKRDNRTGKCIKKEKPPCPPNEAYDDCGTHCPLSCTYMNPQPCILSCKSGCFCTNGTIRDTDGICVKPEKCCKLDNEAYFHCYKKHPNSECIRGCFCINNTKRDPISRKCVRKYYLVCYFCIIIIFFNLFCS